MPGVLKYIFIAAVLQLIFACWADNIWCRNNRYVDDSEGENKLSALSNSDDSKTQIKLIMPDSASQVTTFTPTFKWQPVQSDSAVEYRLLIAKIDGKIVFDDWVGQQTTYTCTSATELEDLNPYYWTIYALVNNQQLKSPVWSFWIDHDVVTDLTITDISLLNNKPSWNPGDEVKIKAILYNSGPIDADGCIVALYSGNIDQNYFSYAAHRKTSILDTISVSNLKLDSPQTVTLSGRIPYGFNHFFVRVDPAPGLKDIIFTNNYVKGIKIQTEDRVLSFNGLIIIYKNYIDPEAGEKTLDQNDLVQIHQSMNNFRQYFWDHTHVLKISLDSLHVNRILTDEDFTFQDEQYGYFLHPNQVVADLNEINFTDFDYDFIFVYYSWWNSDASWSAYSGYTLKNQKALGKDVSFLAQPFISGQSQDVKTAIHEFLHLLDILFDESGEPGFYSPHHRTLYTTFSKDTDYYDWMLETWQTQKWFNLNRGQHIQKDTNTSELETATKSLSPKTLVLSQNYPNPFNKITTIIYKIPQLISMSEKARVKLSIYDILGNTVRTLVNKDQEFGIYRVYWDGTDQQGNEISSGIYFYELVSDNQRQVRKLLYIR